MEGDPNSVPPGEGRERKVGNDDDSQYDPSVESHKGILPRPQLKSRAADLSASANCKYWLMRQATLYEKVRICEDRRIFTNPRLQNRETRRKVGSIPHCEHRNSCALGPRKTIAEGGRRWT